VAVPAPAAWAPNERINTAVIVDGVAAANASMGLACELSTHYSCPACAIDFAELLALRLQRFYGKVCLSV
jgi:hypothetical protein